MAICTVFSNFTQVVEDKPLLELLEDIKNGRFRSDIEPIRSLVELGNMDSVNELKKNLLAFTPSATFKGGRKFEYIVNYSGIVHLDFDKLSSIQIRSALKNIQSSNYTYACFISPSGNGIKLTGYPLSSS
ncbi:MAG: BT4734/BF3469 family protein [Bacteroidota bacterium]